MAISRRPQIQVIDGKTYELPPAQKRIGGEIWRYYMAPKSKKEAQKEAKRQTESYGLRTRVVKWRNRWAIYYRHR